MIWALSGFAETALAKERLPDFCTATFGSGRRLPTGRRPLLHSPGQEQALKIQGEIDLTLNLGPNFKLYGGYLIDERPLPTWLEDTALNKAENQPPTANPGKWATRRRRMEPTARDQG